MVLVERLARRFSPESLENRAVSDRSKFRVPIQRKFKISHSLNNSITKFNRFLLFC